MEQLDRRRPLPEPRRGAGPTEGEAATGGGAGLSPVTTPTTVPTVPATQSNTLWIGVIGVAEGAADTSAPAEEVPQTMLLATPGSV